MVFRTGSGGGRDVVGTRPAGRPAAVPVGSGRWEGPRGVLGEGRRSLPPASVRPPARGRGPDRGNDRNDGDAVRKPDAGSGR